MKHKWLLIALICFVALSWGQQAQAVDFSAQATNLYANDTIIVGDTFSIELYGYNDFGVIVGGSMNMVFYSPDGSISNIQHRNVGEKNVAQVPFGATWEDSSAMTYNSWDTYFNFLNFFYSKAPDGWDGVLPDSVNWSGAGLNGWPTTASPTKYISFALQADDAGTLCVDSIFQIDQSGTYDWLWDTEVKFNGPYCWTIWDSTEVANTPPELGTINDQTVNEGELLTFGVTASDVDGDPIALTTGTLPTGANFTDNGDNTGTFSWTPGFEQAGTYPVKFYANDGTDFDSTEITITVNNTNRAPEFSTLSDQSTDEGVLLTFDLTASDPDGDTPTLSEGSLPTGAIFVDNGDGTGTFSWTPGFDQSGIYPVEFYASDGVLADTIEVSITVNDVNRAPEFSAVDDQTVAEGEELLFGVTATDPDLDVPALTATGVPTGASFADNGDGTGTFSWTPDFDQAGDYPVDFIATDGELADTITVLITVSDVNRTPDLAAIDDQSAVESELIAFGVTASDPDGTTPTFDAIDVPTGAVFTDNGDGTGSFEWQTDFEDAGTYEVIFYALDEIDPSLFDSQTVVITVADSNRAPEFGDYPMDPRFVDENDTLEFVVNAFDPDGDIVSIIGENLPENASVEDFGNGDALFTFMPDTTQAGTYEIIFKASDGFLYDSVMVIVEVVDVAAPAQLVVSNELREYTLVQGDNLINDSIYVMEQSDRAIPFTLTGGAAWIETFDVTYTTTGWGYFSINGSGLAVGDYEDTLWIMSDSAGNSPVEVPILLHVTTPEEPVLAADPMMFEYTDVTPGDIIEDSVIIFEVEGGNIDFWTYNKSGWLLLDTLAVSPLITPDTVPFMINTAGLDPGGFYADTIWVWSSATDDSLMIYVSVDLNFGPAVIETVPSMFNFTVFEDGTASDSLIISEFYDRAIDFNLTYDTSWIQLTRLNDPPLDVTPGIYNVMVDAAGLVPGTYHDSIWITPTTEGEQFEDVAVPVTMTVEEIIPEFDVSPTFVVDTLFEGDSLIGRMIFVDEVHDMNVGFGVTTIMGTEWLSIQDMSPYVTPATVIFDLDATALTAGTYIDTILIYDNTGDLNYDSVWVPVMLYVMEAPEPIDITATPPLFDWTLTEGESGYDTLSVVEELDRRVPFFIENSEPWVQAVWTEVPHWPTPADVPIYYSAASLLPGFYTDTLWIMPLDSTPAGYFPPLGIPVSLEVLPEGPMEEDSVWISTVPGVPGSDVMVPVYFRNFDSLSTINLPLMWDSDALYLDSVTFDGTRVEDVDIKVVAPNNDLQVVQIGIIPTYTPDVPPGRGMMARMHFSISTGITQAFVAIDTTRIEPSGGIKFIGSDLNVTVPTFIPGGVVVDTTDGFVCGRVVDTEGNEIEGATVEIWDNFPGGSMMLQEMTDINGQFACHTTGVSPFDAYAYKEGYYPGVVEDIQFGEIGIEIVLTEVSPVTPTPEWVDFYCDNNMFMNVPLPVGSVVDAYDPDGIHCGTYFVTEAGSYGFMPVYRDDIYTTDDEGAEPGDTISFFINGYPANATGDRVWTENGDNFQVCLEIFTVEEMQVALRDGWNLISWNVDTPDDDIETILAEVWDQVEVVLGFEQGGYTYDPDLPEFSTLWTTDHFSGYWVKMNGPAILNLTGTPVAANTSIPLTTGWNLVSYLPDETYDVGVALHDLLDSSNLIVALGFDSVGLTFDPALPEYSNLETMSTGLGYWLKTYIAEVFEYPGMGPGVVFRKTYEPPQDMIAKAQSLDQVEKSLYWIDLYSYGIELDGEAVPAGTEITAVNSSGEVVGAGLVKTGGMFGFVPVYGDDPSTDTREGLAIGEEFHLVVGGVETEESFTWTERGDRVMVASLNSTDTEGLVPDQFGLSQNFPNPFNPTTTIEFSVPSRMDVSVEIYNILGERVRTVFDGAAEAGTNQVVWDGTNASGEQVATGIYFYRMKADSFEKTRKMILMK